PRRCAPPACARFTAARNSVSSCPKPERRGGRSKPIACASSCTGTHFPGAESLPQKRLTMSFGVAEFPTDALTADDLVSRADHALYVAKRLGRDRVQVFGEGEATVEAWESDSNEGDLRPVTREPRVPAYQQRISDVVAILERQPAL